MLYYLLQWLEQTCGDFIGDQLYKYISFRAGIALIISLIITILYGGRIIQFLKRLQVGESIRDLGLEGQKEKEGTPTMGGIIIIMAIVIPCLLVARLDNIYIILMLLTTSWMGIIGFIDDYIKVFKKDKEGLSGRFKILGQVVLALIVGVVMLLSSDVKVRMDAVEAKAQQYEIIGEPFWVDGSNDSNAEESGQLELVYVKTTLTNVPFLKGHRLDYCWFLPFLGDNAAKFVWLIFIPLVILIVTAVSNGANLTDGIDGLATGVCGIIGATLGVLAYMSGNAIAAEYLNILYLPGTGELLVFAACFVGACIGFLWYNAYPAQIFMGDTGSLTLGGIIAAFAIAIRVELLIPILCGIILAENLSVMIQVSYFKYTKRKYGEGRRVFLMSPLHHHYQKKGIHEAKIVARFWIIGILLAALTFITLKIR
ncbi:MAG: phospho-N-acetylmuramoyl-pentapeptide-transferase [Bacteroidota bacterium]